METGYCASCTQIRFALSGLGYGLSMVMGQAAKHRCHYCGNRAKTWDHIVPRALKGPDDKRNLVPACKSCNHAKANKMPTCRCETCMTAVALFGPKVVDTPS